MPAAMRMLIDHGLAENVGDVSMVEGSMRAIRQCVPDAECFLTPHGLGDAPVMAEGTACPVYHARPVFPDPFSRAQPTNEGSGSILSRFLWAPLRYRMAWSIVPLLHRIQKALYVLSLRRPWASVRMQEEGVDGTCSLDAFCARYDALFIAGGLFIEDFPASLFRRCALIEGFAAQGKPVIVHGVQCGRLSSPALVQCVRSALRKASYVSVRDTVSHALLAQDQVILSGDNAQGCLPADEAAVHAALRDLGIEAGRFIAVQVRVGFYTPSMRRELAKVARVLEAVSRQTGLPLLYVPIALGSYDGDARWGEVLAREMQDVPLLMLPVVGQSAAGLVRGVVAAAHGVIGTSYHLCLFGLMVGVPAVCIYADDHYEQKAVGFSLDYGDTRLKLLLRTTDAQTAVSQVVSVLHDQELRSGLHKKIAEYSDRWWSSARDACAILAAADH